MFIYSKHAFTGQPSSVGAAPVQVQALFAREERTRRGASFVSGLTNATVLDARRVFCFHIGH